MNEQPYILSRLRCNELLRDCYGKESAGDLVMLPARELESLIREVKAYRNDPRDKSNDYWTRQRRTQKAKDKAGVR